MSTTPANISTDVTNIVKTFVTPIQEANKIITKQTSFQKIEVIKLFQNMLKDIKGNVQTLNFREKIQGVKELEEMSQRVEELGRQLGEASKQLKSG